jgi:hypothetical protein
MNLQTLFQFAGLPSDFGSVPRARKAKIEAAARVVKEELMRPVIMAGNPPEDTSGAPAPVVDLGKRTWPKLPTLACMKPGIGKTETVPKACITQTFAVQVTDTFGGEANYCYKHDYEITLPASASDRSIVIAAKKVAGWSGVKCDTENYGDSFTLRPRNRNEIMFITFKGY